MDLKERLKEAMEKRDIRVPTLARQLAIPKDRIYAWYRDNSNPKEGDRDKIEKWINEERYNPTSLEIKDTPPAKRTNNQRIDPNSDVLIEIIKNLSDTVKSQQETIQSLTTKQGNASGHTAAAV